MIRYLAIFLAMLPGAVASSEVTMDCDGTLVKYTDPWIGKSTIEVRDILDWRDISERCQIVDLGAKCDWSLSYAQRVWVEIDQPKLDSIRLSLINRYRHCKEIHLKQTNSIRAEALNIFQYFDDCKGSTRSNVPDIGGWDYGNMRPNNEIENIYEMTEQEYVARHLPTLGSHNGLRDYETDSERYFDFIKFREFYLIPGHQSFNGIENDRWYPCEKF